MDSAQLDFNPNSPVMGGTLDTTYFVYIDDSGDSSQDILTALAIPVVVWSDALQKWKKFRQWVAKRHSIGPYVELHALDLGSNSRSAARPLAGLLPGDRNQIAKAAFRTLLGTPEIRVLSVHAPVAEGSGKLYEPMVAFIEEFCRFHQSHAAVWYDGTAPSLQKITRSVHRSLPHNRRVLEDPRGCSSEDSHFIQMADFLAHSAHHAILNDRGIGPADSYLREQAYSSLLPSATTPGVVWPGATDGHGFPAFAHVLGIREYPEGRKAR